MNSETLVKIYATKNNNWRWRKLSFPEFHERTYYIDPAAIDYIDVNEKVIHLADNIAFRIHPSLLEKTIDEIQEWGNR